MMNKNKSNKANKMTMKHKNHILSRLSMALVGLLAVLTVACSDDDNNQSWLSHDFGVSVNTIQMPIDGGVTRLSVRSESEPRVSSNADWCQVNALASNSSVTRKYEVSVDTNRVTDDREAIISVSADGQSQEVKVVQTAAYGLVVECVTPSGEVSAEGGDVTVKLMSNGDYITTLEDGIGWLAQAATRASMTASAQTFHVSANHGPARRASVTFIWGTVSQVINISQADGSVVSPMDATAKELAAKMYPGWNLGNTLEGGSSSTLYTNAGIGTELAWQNTKTTQQLIDYVKSLGFKSVRIPCSWVMGHISSGTTIDPVWMGRVQEVVDYCINAGLYVVLNDHWDGGWLEDSFDGGADVNKNIETLTSVWTQIANHFRGYDEHLIFAGLNEPGQNNQAQPASYVADIVKYEQAFIDAVRATGGNNARRVLVVQGPKTSISDTYDVFTEMPADNVPDRLMAEVHFYEPWQLCGLESDADWGKVYYYWGQANHVDGSDRNAAANMEESWVATQMDKMKTRFVDRGIPVVLGEYSAMWRDVASAGGDQTKHDASVRYYFKTVTEYAINRGIVPFVWDINSTSRPSMCLVNRSNLSVFCQPAMDGINDGVSSATFPQ